MKNETEENLNISIRLTDETVLCIIEKVLSALGESPKRAIWYYLEKDFELSRNEIPRKVGAFEEALQKFFGMGYDFLRCLLLHELAQITGESYNLTETFSDAVCRLHKSETEKFSVGL